MTLTKRFYGRGKLLITGEYVVLDGAEAFAVPTKAGQWLRCRQVDDMPGVLVWIATNHDRQLWKQYTFDLADFRCLEGPDEVNMRLSNLLYCARAQNPSFLTQPGGVVVETELEFPRDWGLGTSSTLVHCVAEWSGTDPYQLLKNTFGGSGYDLACASADGGIVYALHNNKPVVKPQVFAPPFLDQLYFVYLGSKQNSRDAIAHYRNSVKQNPNVLDDVSALTRLFLQSHTLAAVSDVMTQHEELMAAVLRLPKVKDVHFSNFPVAAKSLGAWGGDFAMLAFEGEREALTNYLAGKQMNICFSWPELIYSGVSPSTGITFDLN